MNSTPLVARTTNLLTRLHAGDPHARKSVEDLFRPIVSDWARGLGVRPTDYARVVQNVFAELGTDPTVREASEPFRTWLFRVTCVVCDRFSPNAATGSLTPDAKTAPNWADYDIRLYGRIAQVLRGSADWQTFEFHALNGIPADEAAQLLGGVPADVRAAKWRVLQRIAGEYDGLITLAAPTGPGCVRADTSPDHLAACEICAADWESALAPAIIGFRKALVAEAVPSTADGNPVPPTATGPVVGPPAIRAAIQRLRPPERPGDLARVGNFRLTSVLGYGGMGVVFAAEDERLGRAVAIKLILDPDGEAGSARQRQRFLREARAAAALDHDHVVPIFQADEEGGVAYIVMPLLRGETLADRLKRGRLSPAEVVRLGRQVAEGLAAAHERNLIHRDLKPANIWLESRPDGPRARLLDFGLAKPGDGSHELTERGGVFGTPGYMPPEQILGGQTDARSDLFSLGVTIYEGATGVSPFRGDGVPATLDNTIRTEPAPASERVVGLPAGLSDLIHGLLAKAPGMRRPAEAGLVADELQAIEFASQWPVAPTVRPRKPIRVSRRQFHRFAVGGVVGMLAYRAYRLWPDRPVVDSGPTLDHFQASDIPEAVREMLATTNSANVPLWLVAAAGPGTSDKPNGFGGSAQGLALLPGGRGLIIAYEDCSMQHWDLSGSVPRRLSIAMHPPSDYSSLCKSAEGKVFVARNGNGVGLFESADASLIRSWPMNDPAAGLDISPDGSMIATSHDSYVVQLIDARRPVEKQKPRLFETPRETNYAVRFLDGGNLLAIGGRSGLRVIDLRTGGDVLNQAESKVVFSVLEVSPDGNYLATNGGQAPSSAVGGILPGLMGFKSDPAMFSVRDVRKRFAIRKLLAHDFPVRAAAFSPNGRWLATITENRQLRLWDWNTERVLAETGLPKSENPHRHQSLLFYPDGRHLIADSLGLALILRIPEFSASPPSP